MSAVHGGQVAEKTLDPFALAATNDPANGLVFVVDSTTRRGTWSTPTATPSGSAGGDLTGTYPNPTLAACGPGATGPIGSATVVPIVTIDAKGRVTALSSTTISGVTPAAHAASHLPGGSDALTTAVAGASAPGDAAAVGTAASFARSDHKHSREAFGTTAGTVCQGNDSRLSDSRAPTGSAGGDLTGTYPNPTLAASGVTAATYGTSAKVAQVTIDASGRITAASSVNIALSESGITLADVTTLDVSTSMHGLVPKAPNDTAKFLRGDGTWATPSASGAGVPRMHHLLFSVALPGASTGADPTTGSVTKTNLGTTAVILGFYIAVYATSFSTCRVVARCGNAAGQSGTVTVEAYDATNGAVMASATTTSEGLTNISGSGSISKAGVILVYARVKSSKATDDPVFSYIGVEFE